MTHDDYQAQVDACVARLGEHFDAVEIMVTWMEGRSTYSLSRGSGNFFARKELARQFVEEDNDVELAKAIAEQVKPNADET